MDKIIKREEWYQALIDECKSIITEAIFNSRWALVEGYHNVGKRIREESSHLSTTLLLQGLAVDLKMSERTLWYAVQFHDKYPDLSQVPEGKNITWNKIITKYLPAHKEYEALPLPKGKYRVIYADPPWQYQNIGFDESAEKQYPTMSVEEICALPIQELIIDEAVLFLWVTNAFISEGLQVCKAWGFEYKTNFAWIKNSGPSMGWFTKSRHELLFIATKGEGLHPSEKFLSWFEGKVRKHSQKPECVYEMIEKMYPGPYIELFARIKRKRWNSWGIEL